MNRAAAERWFEEQCAEAGLKVTPQRCQIYALLAKAEDHPDAERILELVRKNIPRVSLDTVYRNLRTLEEHGIIQKVGAIGYRTRFDANTKPHHHFVCTRCGLIRDFSSEELDGFVPPDEVTGMGTVDSIYVELRGICRTCRKKT